MPMQGVASSASVIWIVLISITAAARAHASSTSANKDKVVARTLES